MVNNRVSLYKSRIPVQRALEQTPGGRNPFDSFVFIDSDDNVRTIGLNTESSSGTTGTDVYAPGYCACLPNKEKASKVYKTRYPYCLIIPANSNVYATGYNGNGNCALPAGSGIAAVIKPTLTAISNCSKVIQSTSINFSVSAMFLTYNGTVHSAGFNQYGQLGIIQRPNLEIPVLN
jgi:hypothetical protein